MMLGLILAGGEGRRIGGDKAMISLAGRPLAAHVADALSGVAALAVAGDAACAEMLGATFLKDPPGVAPGPLAGVVAGLDWCARSGGTWLVVTPCDAPLLPHDMAERLRAAAGEGALACAETEAGLEPLISIWRADIAHLLHAALGDGRHPPVHKLLRALGAARLALSRDEAMNVNTPEDLARAELLLSKRS